MNEINAPFPEVVYEDNHLLAIAKPAGMLSQSDATGSTSALEALKEWLKKTREKKGNAYLGLVHRLDRPVCGVMVFAKTSKAASRLSDQFRRGTVEKIYEAVLENVPEEDEGVLEDYLLKLRQKKQVRVVHPNHPSSRKAVLEYSVTGVERDFSLVSVRLLTGRSHQIRVQMASRGWSILGDVKYGSRYVLDDRVIALRAARLSLSHPTRDERMILKTAAPSWWPWPPEKKYRRVKKIR